MTDLAALEIDAFLLQGDQLSQLVSHHAWDGWVALLTTMRQSALEELARCTEPGDFRFWQGAASALGEIIDRPRRIALAAADFQRNEEADKQVIRPDLRASLGLGVDHDGDV